MSGEEKEVQREAEPEQPTRWHCDTDCRAANRPCRGEKGKSDNGIKTHLNSTKQS